MDYGHLLLRAWNVTWQHRSLWWLGLAATAGRLVASLATRLAWHHLFPAGASGPEALERLALDTGPLLAAVLLLAAMSLLFWLLSATAEGGLIHATVRLDQGQPVTLGQAWAAGRRLLVRFVAIDTILFLPLFLVLLASLLLIAAALLGLLVAVMQGLPLRQWLPPLFLAGACLIGLLSLTLPVSWLTVLLRGLAFRAAAVAGLGTGPAIGHGLRLARRHWAHLLILVAMAWALRYAAGIVAALVSLPVAFLGGLPFLPMLGPGPLWAGGGTVALALGLAASLALSLASAVLHVYLSALWTLAYQEVDRLS